MSLDEAGRMAMELPEVTEGEWHDRRTWSVGKKTFAWERNFSKADIKRFGATEPPDGPILAVRLADLHEKEAVLAAEPKGLFDIPHFNGYAGLLVHLRVVPKKVLRETLLDAWLACAPPAVAEEFLARKRTRSRPK